jgi:hypothetical protein
MAFGELLKRFEACEDLPIDLDKVRQHILELGIRHEIEFVGVELDVEIIRGFLYRYRYHEGGWNEPKYAAEIHYDRNQPEEWINIVLAKELIHILDRNVCTKKEEFDNLIRRLALPRELKALLEDPPYALFDRAGDAFASALLLPMAAREALMPAYNEGAMSDKDIAEMAVLPVRYVRSIMSPEWEKVYERLRNL